MKRILVTIEMLIAIVFFAFTVVVWATLVKGLDVVSVLAALNCIAWVIAGAVVVGPKLCRKWMEASVEKLPSVTTINNSSEQLR
jgi:hypothetical protein